MARKPRVSSKVRQELVVFLSGKKNPHNPSGFVHKALKEAMEKFNIGSIKTVKSIWKDFVDNSENEQISSPHKSQRVKNCGRKKKDIASIGAQIKKYHMLVYILILRLKSNTKYSQIPKWMKKLNSPCKNTYRCKFSGMYKLALTA